MPLVLCSCEYFTRFPDFTAGTSWLIVDPENSIRRSRTVLPVKRPSRSLEEPFYTASYDQPWNRKREPIETSNFSIMLVKSIFVLFQSEAKGEIVETKIAEGRRKEGLRKEKRLPRVKSRRRLFVVRETAPDKSTSSFLFLSSLIIPQGDFPV